MNNDESPITFHFRGQGFIDFFELFQLVFEWKTICSRVGTNWYKISIVLKLDIKKLNEVRSLNQDSDFKLLKMFELWLSSKRNGRVIIETLKNDPVGEITVAENIEEFYKKVSNYKLSNNVMYFLS